MIASRFGENACVSSITLFSEMSSAFILKRVGIRCQRGSRIDEVGPLGHNFGSICALMTHDNVKLINEIDNDSLLIVLLTRESTVLKKGSSDSILATVTKCLS